MITFTVYPHPLACIAIGGLHHHSLALQHIVYIGAQHSHPAGLL